MDYIKLELETNYSTHHHMMNKTYKRGDIVVHRDSLYECISDESYNDEPINSNKWRIIS